MINLFLFKVPYSLIRMHSLNIEIYDFYTRYSESKTKDIRIF